MSIPDTFTLACPSCDTLNRVQAGRLDQGPVCGKCAASLTPAAPFDLDFRRLQRHVAKSELPLLVDFWSPACGPCQMMAPQFAQAAAALAPRVRLAKVDTLAHQDAAFHYTIMAAPTLILFRGGREIVRQPGALDASQIVAWTRQHL